MQDLYREGICSAEDIDDKCRDMFVQIPEDGIMQCLDELKNSGGARIKVRNMLLSVSLSIPLSACVEIHNRF